MLTTASLAVANRYRYTLSTHAQTWLVCLCLWQVGDLGQGWGRGWGGVGIGVGVMVGVRGRVGVGFMVGLGLELACTAALP